MTYLITKNITIESRRTSVRLEPDIWESLAEICHLENTKQSYIFSIVNLGKKEEQSLSSAMRVFVMKYFRTRFEQVNKEVNTQIKLSA